MKISSYSIVLFYLCATAGCTLEDDGNPYFTPFYGHGQIWINDSLIDVAPYGHTHAQNSQFFTLNLTQLDKNNFPLASLFVTNIPKETGFNIIMSGNGSVDGTLGAFYTSYLELGHVIGDIFRHDTTLAESYIQIDRYDVANDEVEGIFKVKLVRKADFISSPYLPDTMNIEGDFFTRI